MTLAPKANHMPKHNHRAVQVEALVFPLIIWLSLLRHVDFHNVPVDV